MQVGQSEGESPCELGPVIAARSARPVADYPVVLDLDDATRAERAHTFEAKVPGWHVAVDRTGFPIELTHPIALPIVPHDTPEHDALVTAVFTTLHDDLGLGPHASITSDSFGNWIAKTDTPAARYVSVSARQVEAPPQIVIKVIRVIPLPARLHLIPIAEFVKQWGTSPTAAIEIARMEEGHPCDPVHSSHDCDGAGPSTHVECEPLLPAGQWLGALQYDMVSTSRGYRWVVRLYLQVGPCHEPQCKLRIHVPPCTDAVTGETLSAEVCKQPE